MHYRSLGRTDPGQPLSYAFGGFRARHTGRHDDANDTVRLIHKALDEGINFIETADSYREPEVVVGNAIKDRRDSVVLATKVGPPSSVRTPISKTAPGAGS